MSFFSRILPLFILTTAEILWSQAISATAGTSHTQNANLDFAYSITLFAKVDEQTLVGVQSGHQITAGRRSVPLLASAFVRLPFGRVVLPVATWDGGYVFADSRSRLLWRLGGGLDIKNGERSSILILGGMERAGSAQVWYSRIGLMLEI